MTRSKLTTIAVSEEVHEALRNLGRAGESFNDVLKKLLELEGEVGAGRARG